ncbi:MAG: hypothetical protein JWR37_683 [Mycobacterium sp.]|nr:hypothetical protein [Mycobacterium sp.]
MTSQLPIDRSQLRALVREVVRDVVSGTVSGMVPPAPTTAAAPPPPSVAEQIGVQPIGPLAADEKSRTDTVRIISDQDLQAFVRHLLRLFENPKTRTDLRTGRLSFRLAGNSSAAAAATYRIDSGAVTERQLASLAPSGGVLALGPKAVLTPLAREKARALGITIQKERT